MSEITTRLVTYDDAIRHAVDYLGASVAGDALRDARRCVQNAYRNFASITNWSYYYAHGRIVTNAVYDTGTITYDHCVTPDHEALTRDGWKTYDKISVGDEILSYDHDREVCCWKPVENIHTFQYSGKVLSVERKGRVVLRCTPNHRLPVYERYGKPRKLRKKWITAKELTMEHYVPLSARLDQDSSSEESCRLAALLGWVVTDGHGLFLPEKPWRQVGIGQSHVANSEKCAEIELLVGRKPWKGSRDQHIYGLKPRDRRILKSLIKSKDDLVKHFCSFGFEEADEVCRAMGMAESSRNPNGTEVFSQWGDNKPVAEAFQVASLLAGRAVNISSKEYEGKTRYQCPVRSRNRIKLAKQSKWEDYSGIVWCPQVSTGAWVMRCNGAVMITGNSGGAYEHMVTLTGGTFPDWTFLGTIRINNVDYDVADLMSSTVLRLATDENPGSDIASATEYTLYRDTYPLPVNFQSADDMYLGAHLGLLTYVNPNEWLLHQAPDRSPAVPALYTITSDPNYFGTMGLRLSPPPLESYNIDYIYRRRPRQMLIQEYKTGTASVSVNSDTVTGTGTNWKDNHVGSIIRFSEVAGSWPTGVTGDNPFEIQRTIIAVNSATELQMDRLSSQTFTDAKYTISDAVDVEDGAMLTGFFREVEKELRIARRMKPAEGEEERYMQAIMQAREADSRTMSSRRIMNGSFYGPYRRNIYQGVAGSDIT